MSKCRYDLSEDCNNRDCLNCVLNKIRAEIQTEVTHWLNRRDFYDDWKHIDLTGTPWLKENKHRNLQEIACARYSARAEGLEKALEIIDKCMAERRVIK